MISASTSVTTLSTQLVISSRAANLVFQFASPRSVRMDAGMRSAARASESSGVCLNLKVSNAPGDKAVAGFDGFEAAPPAGFLVDGAAGELAAVGGFLL